jgi:COP9 signalosome complex subunit 4
MAVQCRAQLAQLASSGGSHRDLAEKYRGVLDGILQLGEDDLVDSLKAFIEAIVNENVSLVISRQLLSEVGAHLAKLQEDSIAKAVSHYTLEIVQPRVISFEDQVIVKLLYTSKQLKSELSNRVLLVVC